MIKAIFAAIQRWFEPMADLYGSLPPAAQRRLLGQYL